MSDDNHVSEPLRNYRRLSVRLLNPFYYYGEFEKSLNSELCNYCIILVWKTFLLYSYERIRQVRLLMGDDAFVELYWSSGQLASPKFNIKNYPVDKVFSYNNIEDSDIIQLLERVFNLDRNYVGKLTNIKQDRNTAAHVAEKEFDADERHLIILTEQIVNIANKIEDNFNGKFIQPLSFSDKESWAKVKMTFTTLKFLINNRILSGIKNANTYDQAKTVIAFIAQFADKLNETDIARILDASIANDSIEGRRNQVVFAFGISDKFNVLLERTYKLGGDLEMWRTFYNSLGESSEYFKNIRSSLEQHGLELDENMINPDEIPF